MNIISTVHTPTSLTSTCSSPGPDSGHGICLELAWGRCSRHWPCHQRLPLHCCLVIQVFSLPTTSSAVIPKLSLSVDRAVLRKAAGVIMEINDLYIVSQPLFAKTSLQGIWSKIYFSIVKKNPNAYINKSSYIWHPPPFKRVKSKANSSWNLRGLCQF